jgi:hypothetical protein
MAEATFILRAIDSTKAAFASVQNSLSRLERSSMTIAKVSKGILGGGAILGTLNLLKSQMDKVVESSEEMGMSDEQILAAMEFEHIIKNILGYVMQIAPLIVRALGGVGEIVGLFDKVDVKKKITEFRTDREKKEIKSLGETLQSLQDDFDSIGESSGASLKKATTEVSKLRSILDKVPSEEPSKILVAESNLQKALNKEKTIQTEIDAKLAEANIELRRNLPTSGVSTGKGLQNMVDRLGFELSDLSTKIEFAPKEDIGPLLDERITKTLELSAAQAKLNVVLEKEQRVFEAAGEMISQGFEDAILSGQKLGDVLRSLGQDLLRLVFQQTITSPLAGGISTALKAMFMAEGGPVRAGSPYVVGEKGPELFVSNSSGSIVPNSKMSSGGGGGMGGVTVNYNIAAGVSRAELVPILEQERRRLKAEIPDMVRRGGSYRSAFA